MVRSVRGSGQTGFCQTLPCQSSYHQTSRQWALGLACGGSSHCVPTAETPKWCRGGVVLCLVPKKNFQIFNDFHSGIIKILTPDFPTDVSIKQLKPIIIAKIELGTAWTNLKTIEWHLFDEYFMLCYAQLAFHQTNSIICIRMSLLCGRWHVIGKEQSLPSPKY